MAVVLAVSFAAVVAALACVSTTAERRNPHAKARSAKWWTRPPR